jgi:hypothetical protein
MRERADEWVTNGLTCRCGIALLAESHLTRRLFGSMLRRIWTFPVPTG